MPLMDTDIVDIVQFLRKHNIQHFKVTAEGIDVKFNQSGEAMEYSFADTDSTYSDETSNYCLDKDKN